MNDNPIEKLEKATSVERTVDENRGAYNEVTKEEIFYNKNVRVEVNDQCRDQAEDRESGTSLQRNYSFEVIPDGLLPVVTSHSSFDEDCQVDRQTFRRRQKTGCIVFEEASRLNDIIGHSALKTRVQEILLPLKLPLNVVSSVLKGIRSMPASILLYGPPGCGKTKLARAIAGEARAAFIPISPSDVLSKFVGESESAIRDIFEKAAKQAFQTESKCAVIFFDEIDALGLSRESRESGAGDGCSRRVLAELLVQLNHIISCKGGLVYHTCNEIDMISCVGDNYGSERPVIQNNLEHVRVIVVGATNRILDCDDALKRRFGVQLEVGLPSCRDRKKMIVRYLQDIETTLTQEEIEYISFRTETWTGSDIENLVRDATMTPVRECIKKAAACRKRKSTAYDLELNPNESDVDPASNDRTVLLREITAMRPVTLSDFDKSFSFFTGQDFFIASTKCRRSYTRFDCQKEQDSSSEEDEQTPTTIG